MEGWKVKELCALVQSFMHGYRDIPFLQDLRVGVLISNKHYILFRHTKTLTSFYRR